MGQAEANSRQGPCVARSPPCTETWTSPVQKPPLPPQADMTTSIQRHAPPHEPLLPACLAFAALHTPSAEERPLHQMGNRCTGRDALCQAGYHEGVNLKAWVQQASSSVWRHSCH